MGRGLATSLLPAPRLTLQPCQRGHGASSMPPPTQQLTSLSLLPAGGGGSESIEAVEVAP